MNTPNRHRLWIACLLSLSLTTFAFAADSGLPKRIDEAIGKRHEGPLAPRSSDAEFLRRVTLDLSGTIPTADAARKFLADASPNKRTALIGQLLAAPSYARRMQQAFDVILMERRVGKEVPADQWETYLQDAFTQNKPWDQLVRELIASDGVDPKLRPAMNFFLARGATNHKGHARDLGRLLLGRDMECAQCHDHPVIKDFKQADFYGLVAFMRRSYLYQDKKTKEQFFAEKGIVEELKFSSAFTGEEGTAVPHLPSTAIIEVPKFEKGQELAKEAEEGKPPIAKFPLRPKLAEALTSPENAAFKRNAANRLWAMMMGRGLVYPLDMHHAENPPSHPELLTVLADELAKSKFDVKAFLRALATSEAYQRASLLPEGVEKVPAESFAAANAKPLSAEQMVWSVLEATGNLKQVLAAPATPAETAKYRPDKGKPIPAENKDSVLKLFRSVYAAQAGQTEDEFNPSLASALFVSNEKLLLKWLTPQPGNLLDRLVKLEKPEAVADELYLSVLTRVPSDEERADVAAYLKDFPEARETALREMAWALLASTEFRLNH